MGTQPPPRGLKRAASKVSNFTAFDRLARSGPERREYTISVQRRTVTATRTDTDTDTDLRAVTSAPTTALTLPKGIPLGPAAPRVEEVECRLVRHHPMGLGLTVNQLNVIGSVDPQCSGAGVLQVGDLIISLNGEALQGPIVTALDPSREVQLVVVSRNVNVDSAAALGVEIEMVAAAAAAAAAWTDKPVSRNDDSVTAPAVAARVAAAPALEARAAMAIAPLHPVAAAEATVAAAASAVAAAAAAWTDKPHRPSQTPAYHVRGFIPDGMPPMG